MQLTALRAQNRSGLHFCTFIIVRPLSHTRSSKLLCNLLHCELRIALDCIFALLSSSDHSHTPDLVNYYATYCDFALPEYGMCLSLCVYLPEHQLQHNSQLTLIPLTSAHTLLSLSPLYLCSYTHDLSHYHRCAS